MIRDLNNSSFEYCIFFFNDTATTEIYTLSLHDALPICPPDGGEGAAGALGVLSRPAAGRELPRRAGARLDGPRRGGGVQDGRRAGPRDPERMSPRPRAERRQNRPLREVLDDLLGHAREIARRAKQMTPADPDYAQQRLGGPAAGGGRVGPGRGPPAAPPPPRHSSAPR